MICALIVSLVALFWSTIRTHYLKRKMRRIEKIVDGYFLMAFSGLLAQVALADGKVSDEEIATVRNLFGKMGLTETERAMCIGNCMMVKKGYKNAREGAKVLMRALNPTARTFLYTLLWRVANADRCISEDERRVLNEIGELFKLDSEILSCVQTGRFPKLDRKALDEAGVPASLTRLARSGVAI